MSERTYCCAACGEEFEFEEGWDPQAEAESAFTPAELADSVTVCDDCWKAMRAAIPEMDARYPIGEPQCSST